MSGSCAHSGAHLIEQLAEQRMDPGRRVHAVGDGVDPVAREHLPRRLGMAHGHAVDPVAEIERQPGHVEHVGAGEMAQLVDLEELAQHLLDQLVGEAVVAGLDRRVGGEDAAARTASTS